MSTGGERPAPPLRAVAFDFDGVILESGSIKQQAFLDLFAHRPDLQPQILAHHRRHLGVSRHDKLAWIHRELLGRSLSSTELAEEGRRFSELVLDKVLACPFVDGAEELLRSLTSRIPCFVVSATPQEELELIVDRRGLDGYFREIRGTPGQKADILIDLMRCHRLAPGEMVMVGDGLSDYRGAQQAGVPFILRQTSEQDELFDGIEVERVGDMAELGPLLESRLEGASTQPLAAGPGAESS
ncbi:MAG: HAD family hydrolase [Thermoanaerobaculia bacterium]